MFCWLVPRHQAEVAATTWTNLRLPRQRVGSDAATSYPSERTRPSILYTIHTAKHRNQPARQADDGWRRRYTNSLPSIVAPGNRRSPSIGSATTRRRSTLSSRSTSTKWQTEGTKDDEKRLTTVIPLPVSSPQTELGLALSSLWTIHRPLVPRS